MFAKKPFFRMGTIGVFLALATSCQEITTSQNASSICDRKESLTYEQAVQCKYDQGMKNQAIFESLNSNDVANHGSPDTLAGEALLDQMAAFRETSFVVDNSTVYTIPVVVHVIHLGEAIGVGTNITDAQIISGITNLNERSRKVAGSTGDGAGVDTAIQFALAKRDPNNNPHSGINRVNGSSVADYAANGIRGSGTVGAVEVDVKALSRWDHSKYYNIWVVSETEGNNGGGGIQGYAYFPSTSSTAYQKDGTVILYNAFGTTGNLKSYTSANTVITHESGHYISLYHTFNGTSACGTEASCLTGGDKVCDTPVTIQATSCSSPACSGTQQVQNYLDYTGQSCQNMFTQGQKDRMRDSLVNLRTSITTSLGATPVNNLDIGIQNVLNVSSYNCGNTTQPSVTLVNVGTNAITTAVVQYRVDSGSWISANFSGNLLSGQVANLALPSLPTLASGAHSIEFNVTSPNGSTDQNLTNNSKTLSLNIPSVLDSITVSFVLDYFGSENSYTIKDSSGVPLFSDGAFANNAQGTPVSKQLCLPVGCHQLTVLDSSGDGQSFTSGSYSVKRSSGEVLASGSGNWGASVVHNNICIGQGTIPNETIPPVVSITSPATGTTYTSQTGATIAVSATDASGISKVQFFRNGQLLSEDLAAPYSYGWGFAASNNGANSFTAVAYDAVGNTATSTPVVLNINIAGGPSPTPDTTAPVVSISYPANGATFNSVAAVNITANASDTGGVAKVQFYKASTLLGEDTSSPFSYSWNITSANNGSNALTAKAFDFAGNPMTSTAITVTINISAGTGNTADTTPPVVSLDGIENNSTVSTLRTVNLISAAADNMGVTKVEFYDNGNLKSTDTSTPYEFMWNVSNTMNGVHNWTARAYDAASNKTTSSSLFVNVEIEGGTSEDTPIEPSPTDPVERGPASDGGQLQVVDKVGFCGTVSDQGRGMSKKVGLNSNGKSVSLFNKLHSWILSAVAIFSWFLPFLLMTLTYRVRMQILKRL